jgi:hypothetical protein
MSSYEKANSSLTGATPWPLAHRGRLDPKPADDAFAVTQHIAIHGSTVHICAWMACGNEMITWTTLQGGWSAQQSLPCCLKLGRARRRRWCSRRRPPSWRPCGESQHRQPSVMQSYRCAVGHYVSVWAWDCEALLLACLIRLLVSLRMQQISRGAKVDVPDPAAF